MQELHIHFKRTLCDFVFTLFLTAILCILLMNVINLTISDISYSIGFLVLLLSILISIFHWSLCKCDIYLWKFAFLLPRDIIYYIIARNNGDSDIIDEEITIELPEESAIIRSKPNEEPDPDSSLENLEKIFKKTLEGLKDVLKNLWCKHSDYIIDELIKSETSNKIAPDIKFFKYNIKHLSRGESEEIILWLHTKGDRILKANSNDKSLNISISHGDWNCSSFDYLGSIYLLLSKNVILLLARSLLLLLISFLILLQNPPLLLVADPSQIQEKLIEGEGHFVIISAKNIGCDLLNASLSNMSSSKEINASWIYKTSSKFAYGDIRFINISIDRECPPGEYVGSIIIDAKANRIISISFPFNHICTIGQTSAEKLVEVPFFFKIIPKLNAIPLEQQKL